MSTTALYDVSGNRLDLNLDISEQMDMTDAEQMMSAIVQTGQLQMVFILLLPLQSPMESKYLERIF